MTADYEKQRAWVVFSGKADLPWLRFLKPGFRHCFVLLHDGLHWFSCDPMLNRTEIRVHRHVPADYDLPSWLAGRGLTVVPARMERAHKSPAPWMFYSCVEAVKRVLGLRRFFIFTPWQLYRHLIQHEQKGDLSWEA